MEIITNTTDFYLKPETAAALGKFDGVHIGHRRLLDEIILQKSRGLAACVFTFDPAPAVYFGSSDGRELTSREEKRLLFERMGVDILVEFPLNEETAPMPPEAFAVQVLARQMNVRFVAAGGDLSFGAGGAGDAALLRRLGPELGFEVKTIEKVCLGGAVVSSTCVRGRERLLGMPYMVAGRVSEGQKLGRRLGFPTANVIPGARKLMPPNGVYFSKVRHGGRMYRAISNVGYKPTVASERLLGLESYLYDFDGRIYGEEIEVYLCEFLRPERRFESVEALQAQLRKDIAAGAAFA